MTITELLNRAKNEYETDGTLHTDTYMELSNAGIDPDIYMSQLYGEVNG